MDQYKLLKQHADSMNYRINIGTSWSPSYFYAPNACPRSQRRKMYTSQSTNSKWKLVLIGEMHAKCTQNEHRWFRGTGSYSELDIVGEDIKFGSAIYQHFSPYLSLLCPCFYVEMWFIGHFQIFFGTASISTTYQTNEPVRVFRHPDPEGEGI